MTLYVDTRGQLKAWRQPMVCIKAMFHKVSVEHKLMPNGTATNVPRDCSTELGMADHEPSAWFKWHIQTSVYIASIARMNTVRLSTRTIHYQSTKVWRGEGVSRRNIFIIAIHKPAPQKFLQRGSSRSGLFVDRSSVLCLNVLDR